MFKGLLLLQIFTLKTIKQNTASIINDIFRHICLCGWIEIVNWSNSGWLPLSQLNASFNHEKLREDDLYFANSVDDCFPPSSSISKSQSWVLDRDRMEDGGMHANCKRSSRKTSRRKSRNLFCSLSGLFASGFVAPVQLHHLLDLLLDSS